MPESGDTDPTAPKEMQQNPPNPTGEGGDRDEEAGEKEFVEELENDLRTRAATHRART